MLHKNFCKTGLTALTVACAIASATNANAVITDYDSNFNGLLVGDPSLLDPVRDAELANDGWKVFADVSFATFPPPGYNYGPFSAPNGGAGFSGVATGEGEDGAGDNYLNVYSDYNNDDHGTAGSSLFTTVFQEQFTTEMAGDTATYFLTFDYKSPSTGGIAEPASNATTSAFIHVLDPSNSFGQSGVVEFDTTNALTDTWQTVQIALAIDGVAQFQQVLQFGFHTTATGFEDSGVFYDNICFNRTGVCAGEAPPAIPVPAAVWLFGSGLLGLVGVARRRKS